MTKLLKNRKDGISGHHRQRRSRICPRQNRYLTAAKVNSRRPKYAIEDEDVAEAV